MKHVIPSVELALVVLIIAYLVMLLQFIIFYSTILVLVLVLLATHRFQVLV